MFVADTSLLDAVMRDETVLDRILATDSRFQKFRKVLNDERAAAILDFEDVAHMLGMPIQALISIANGEEPASSSPIGPEPHVVDRIDPSLSARTLNLRPLFERGVEPLSIVLEEISALATDTALMIEAPFHPLPLRRLLSGRGFDSLACQIAAEHWRVLFTRRDAARDPASMA
jgi:hypothetical protein